MTEAKAKQLLDRDLMDTFVAEKLSPTITLLRELVDYGADLIHRAAQRHENSRGDLIIIGHFLKHAITMLDGVEIQLSRGAVSQATVSARSMLETYIYLSWLLKEDTERRTRQFYVWHQRQQRVWVRRMIPGTTEHAEFAKCRAAVPKMTEGAQAELHENDARRQDAVIGKFLSDPQNRAFNDAFEKIKRKNSDVHWYQPGGPNSVRDMAKRLNLDVEYDVFYSQFSDVSHATAFDKNVKFRNGTIILEQIRNPEGFRTVVNHVSTLALEIFRSIIARYFPQDMEAYNLTYVTKWRERFFSVPEVVIKRPTDDKKESPVSTMTP